MAARLAYLVAKVDKSDVVNFVGGATKCENHNLVINILWWHNYGNFMWKKLKFKPNNVIWTIKNYQ